MEKYKYFCIMDNNIKTGTTLSKNLKPFVAIMGVVVGILLIRKILK